VSQVDTSAFDLGEPGGDAALCLHGLTGTPYEVRPLGEALAKDGIRARGPALPGHNATPEQLAPLPYSAWLEAARAELEALRVEHHRVFAVGLSMGGLLALALAAEGRPDAIAVVGTPLRFRAPLPQLIPIAKRLRPMLPKKLGSDIRDPAARARHPSYPVMPLESVHQIIRLQKMVREGLSQIRVPTLVAHGRHDSTASLRDARTIHQQVSGSELLVLENSAHVVPVDYDGSKLAAAVSEFLGRRGRLGLAAAGA
jgi:carboxylesterase